MSQDMSLYTYFKKKTEDPTSNHLPNENGTLLKIGPSYVHQRSKQRSERRH